MSRMDQAARRSRHGPVFPLQYIGMESYVSAHMTTELDLPMHRLDRVPVLLLGGINLVRTLGLAGIPAIVASTERDDPVFASRYCVGRCVLPALEHPDALVDALVRIGDRLSMTYERRVPLMYGSDEYLEIVHFHRERLQRYFRFIVSDPHVAEALIEKERFQAFAEARDLPVPRSLAWEDSGPASLAGAPGMVLAKPRSKIDWHAAPLRDRLFPGGAKARIFASGREAAGNPTVALYRDHLTFQEYIPGDDRCLWSFHGLADEKGEVLASFVGRKIRTHPPDTGESAFIELGHDDELTRLGRDIARRLPLQGVFKMDFKKDAQTGRWHLLEINARCSLWHYLAASNGLNLMRLTYDYLLEATRPAHPVGYRTDYRWLSLALDYRAFRELNARGELGALAWLSSILFSSNVYNVFSWDDPGPWLRFWANRVSRRWTRGSHVLLSVLRQWRSTAS
jgi:D-aspartate ligase